jgi:hypothetical protein
MFLFKIELLSTGVIGLPSARWLARRVLWVACASDRIYTVKEQRLRCANCNAPRGCVLAWGDGIGFVAPALEGPCYLSYMCGSVLYLS